MHGAERSAGVALRNEQEESVLQALKSVSERLKPKVDVSSGATKR